MKFLIDAQLPQRAVTWLAEMGFDAVHTLSLPRGNRTDDVDIASMADAQGRIVLTKDSDFADSRRASGTPAMLVTVATGNISNRDLEPLLRSSLLEVVEKLAVHPHLRITSGGVEVCE